MILRTLSFAFAALWLVPAMRSVGVDRLDPPFWWTGMPVSELQLQLYGRDLGNYRANVSGNAVRIVRQVAVDSRNYLFLYLEIDPGAQPGMLTIELSNGEGCIVVEYPLLEGESPTGPGQGIRRQQRHLPANA